MINQALKRCAKKGRESLALYDNSEEHIYALSLSIITTLFDDVVQVIHYDDGLLYLFVKPKFKRDDLAKLGKIFNSRNYLPESVLFDILNTKQGILLTREVYADGILETTYADLKGFEGWFDPTDIEINFLNKGLDVSDLSVIIFKVGDYEEFFHENRTEDQMGMPLCGATETQYNSFQLIRDMVKNRMLLQSTINKVVKNFKRSNARSK